MATRFNVGHKDLPSGYANKNVYKETSIPSCGLEDVDVALFNLFDKQLTLQVGVNDTVRQQSVKKVPVMFASGEKWALLKLNRPIRDNVGTLILPLITIARTGIQQELNNDITGRGINQQTGEIKIMRRLDESDRDYQNLINRLYIKNQKNLATSPADATDNPSSDRELGDLSSDAIVLDGGLMIPDRTHNIYETIVLPSPQFYSVTYEVTFWCQYTQHMNQLLETLIASFLPQGQAFRIESPKGYWFMANMLNANYNPEVNFDNMSQEERLIKYKFSINVAAYVLGSSVPGAPVALRSYLSQPMIQFKNVDPLISAGTFPTEDPFLGADDPTLSLSLDANHERDQRNHGGSRLNHYQPTNDPALTAYERGRTPENRFKYIETTDEQGRKIKKPVRINTTNPSTGETVFTGDLDLGSTTIVFSDS